MNFDLHGFGPALWAGTLMTIQLAVASVACGLVLGLLGALAKTSRSRILRLLGDTYSTLVRGVPELYMGAADILWLRRGCAGYRGGYRSATA